MKALTKSAAIAGRLAEGRVCWPMESTGEINNLLNGIDCLVEILAGPIKIQQINKPCNCNKYRKNTRADSDLSCKLDPREIQIYAHKYMDTVLQIQVAVQHKYKQHCITNTSY